MYLAYALDSTGYALSMAFIISFHTREQRDSHNLVNISRRNSRTAQLRYI